MQNLLSIVGKRNLPGVIILDAFGNLQFMNETVKNIVPIISRDAGSGTSTVPEKIRNVCLQVRKFKGGDLSAAADVFYCALGNPYSIRAFPLGEASENSGKHIMVLIEPVVEKHQINFEEIQKETGISNRELEVLKLMCQGLNNREIAERLFISVHTTKDHVKSILRAFDAVSRSEVVAAINH
jgi:DNA-binding CsgD family transcriptional regulator